MPLSRCSLRTATALTVCSLSFVGCASARRGAGRVAAGAPVSACDLAAASPWIRRWFTAWELMSQQVLRIPDAPAPDFVFYDTSCVYTTSRVTTDRASAGDGPT